MPLLKHGAFTDDPWTHVADDAPLPDGPAIVTLTRFLDERDALVGRDAPLGVLLQGGTKQGDDPRLIADDLAHIDLVALEFPVFKNGRAYTWARLLRERFGFKGELRAVGEVQRDQLMFMNRCGFDSYEVPDNVSEDCWRDAVSEISVWYQATADGRPTAISLRERLAERARARSA